MTPPIADTSSQVKAMPRMNVLLIGSGGREHALAWALAHEPAADQALLRAGECRHRRDRRVRRARCRRPRGRDRAFAERTGIDFVVIGPEAPLVGGARRRACGAPGIKHFGPSQGGGAARRLEGLHQGSLPGVRHSDRAPTDASRMRRRPRPISRGRGCRSSSRRTGSRPARASSSPRRATRPRPRSTPASPAPSARPAPRS